MELEARVALEALETRLLESDVVVRVEIIDADDRIPPCQKSFAQVVPDEAGAAGDHDPGHELATCHIDQMRSVQDGAHRLQYRICAPLPTMLSTKRSADFTSIRMPPLRTKRNGSRSSGMYSS